MSAAAAAPAATEEIDELRRLVKKREAELADLQGDLDRAESDSRNYEHQLYEALRQVERAELAAENAHARPFRPDVKRMDAGDWIRACGVSTCDVCGYQYWEHATVPGFDWVHRICDGKLVKL